MTSTTPQLLPVHIEYDGPAPVDTYFNPTKDGNGKVAAFRGRVMHGVDLALPEGYAGVVLNTDASESKDQSAKSRSKTKARIESGEDGKETRLNAVSTFTEIGLWRADVPVDLKADEYARALDEWTRMAALVHAPDEEDLPSINV
ncbi:ribonuclease H1 small subunit [Ceratobasidium sp. AG-I]|nr:ribonuclease H1 small subunit [Ceratobasidium sp. AG-I]